MITKCTVSKTAFPKTTDRFWHRLRVKLKSTYTCIKVQISIPFSKWPIHVEKISNLVFTLASQRRKVASYLKLERGGFMRRRIALLTVIRDREPQFTRVGMRHTTSIRYVLVLAPLSVEAFRTPEEKKFPLIPKN